MQRIYGFIVWFIVTLFVVYSFCLNTAAAVFAAPITATLHASVMEVSLATSAFVFGFAVMQIPAGYLLDKYNARWVVSLGVLLLALGNVLISFAHHLIVFTLANLIQGLGAAFAFIAAGILIAQWFALRLFPILFGLTQTLSCIATGIIHYVFTLQLATHPWNVLYQRLAVFGFGLLIITVLLVKTPANYQQNLHPSLKQSLLAVIHNKQILLCAAAAATSFGVLLAYASLWYLQVEEFYHVQKLQAVIVSGLIFAGIGIGTPLLGWLSNLLHSRKLLLHVSLTLGTMALLLGLYAPNYAVNTLIVVKSVAFLIGFFLSGSMLLYTVVSEIASNETRGVALSIINTAVFLFNTLMLFIPLFFVTSVSKTFFTYLWILPFSILIALLLVYFIHDTFKESTS